MISGQAYEISKGVIPLDLASLEWVDGGNGYYCAQQLYLGDGKLRVDVFNA